MPTDPSALLLGCAALVACGVLTASFHRWPAWGIGLYTTVQLWESHQSKPRPLAGGGLDLLPTDVLTVCLLTAALIMLGRERGRRAPAALLFLLGLTALALASGAWTFGIQRAGNEARTAFIQLFSVALFVAALPPGRKLLRTVTRVWTVAGCTLACVALMWWWRTGIGSNSDQLLIDGVLTDARPLGPDSALVIGQAAVILLCGHGFARARVLAWPLLAVVVLMQHRTAWLATGIMFAGWLLSRRHQAGSRAAALAAVGTLGTLALVTVSWGAAQEVTSSLAASGEDDTTLLWRVEGWLALLPQLDGVQDWLVGLPFGTGYERMVHGMLNTVSPHSYYVQVLMRLGLVGLAALLLLYARAWRAAGTDDDYGLLLRLLVGGLLVFTITYPLFPEQAVILGLLASRTQPRSAPTPRTPQESPCPAKPHSSPASPARTARI